MSKLTEKAMLVNLSIAYWTGKASDDRVADELTAKHKTARDVHEYKKLLAKPDYINPVKAARSRARTYLFDKTSPWIDGGTRVLSSSMFFDFKDAMREMQSEYETEVAKMIRAYPAIKGEARKRLGTLYREEDFPTLEQLKRKFGWSLSVMPIPDKGDWRVELDAKSEAEVKRQIDERVAEAEAIIAKDLWQRLYTAVEALATKLKDTDAIFRDSIIGNIVELCDLLPQMNVGGDAKLDKMAMELKGIYSKMGPDTLDNLREDKKARKQTADAASAILEKMKGYIGEAS